MFNLKGRVAVITGASSGLGRQMAKGFAKQGADLVLLARRVERLEELKTELEQLNIKVLPIKCDVTSTEDIENAVNTVKKEFNKVDILVNCAGSSKDKGVLDMQDDEWDFTINTDLTSVFKMTRAFANLMKENNYGRIINIASMYGMVGNSEIPTIAYHASKGGVVNFTRAAAAELAVADVCLTRSRKAIGRSNRRSQFRVCRTGERDLATVHGLDIPADRCGDLCRLAAKCRCNLANAIVASIVASDVP